MTSLDKLSVQGIRSFSPEQPQMVRFLPLTLILGPNGSGKTTLIECLRYATSGEYPPNTAKGKTWVHDPSLMRKPNLIRAQVKLQFIDSQQQKSVITRSLELKAQNKQGKVHFQMRTLDASIQRNDRSIVNAKCVDIEHEMPTLLGVSKAVLTNVIFCHQEDSNWPLSESKVLKEKFDAIFGSLSYVKVLKKIKDLRKEHLNAQSLKEKELQLFAEQKEQKEKLEKELNEKNIKLGIHKETVQRIERELKPIESEYKEIESKSKDKEQEAAKIESKIAEERGKLKAIKKFHDEVKSKIKEPFTGTMEELQIEIEKFSKDVDDAEGKNFFKQELENQITRLEGEINLEYKNQRNFDKEKMELKVRMDLKLQNKLMKKESRKSQIVCCEEEIQRIKKRMTNTKSTSKWADTIKEMEEWKLCPVCCRDFQSTIQVKEAVEKFKELVGDSSDDGSSFFKEQLKIAEEKLHKLQTEQNSNDSLDEMETEEENRKKIYEIEIKQKETEQKLKQLKLQKEEFTRRKDCLNDELISRMKKQKEFENYQKLFEYRSKIEELLTFIREEEEKLNNSPIIKEISNLKKEMNTLSNKLMQLRSEKDRAYGNMRPTKERTNEIEKELALEKYQKASENYRRKLIEVQVESIICEDMDKYYKALDHSIMTYHERRMADINKLMYKYWRQTYRGSDIDFIKIAFDVEEHSAETRRSFNYRVVMVKNGVEMDMRGRCSAGQKVLASLVIRLALAEIFCVNCGIIALDEPTTNLDQENIHSFANAISEIVKDHKQKNNFQLIIITHDEEFLKCLDDESNDYYYYRVFKDENGYSKVKKCSVKERI
ncbi:hypothetical protein B4U79_10117 [Dinothrombium tinctorium]|uniref:DNA repair protein RAD50 n=1 Tax=Dinothrombium tinctorium TaxID=1965070 RepID=A0A3S3Q9H9_9ACAR|nr:hypothetical protein B4U79_01424 [Dinothrombium tinctorium]RWS05805.1 hypothetical protein B4U79_13112 [Dinothrombium tinctorium]RWS14724.1 hypothetical protein B4U79_02772 [Dinothrombium tinctorium]RWS14725.1 hypothetical protein B4U79_10117 [Dinothrombium tinctorium]